MPQCSVFGCNVRKDLHRFPQKDEVTCQVWIHKCYRKDKFNVKSATICKKHFEDSCFERDLRNELLGLPTRRLLKPGSVPTLHLPTSCTLNSESSDRASRARNRSKPATTDYHTIPDDSAVADNRPRRKRSETEVLRMKVKDQRVEIARLKNKVRFWKRKFQLERTKMKSNLRETLSKCFSPGQIKRLSSGAKKSHWDSTDMQMAVRLRALSRRAYNLLKDELNIPLPAPSTLSAWISRTVCAPGIQTNILNFLRNQVEEMSLRDRCCVLCIDEMSIRKDIDYSRLLDRVFGPHTKMVVVMLRGLFNKWKQPVYFNFDTLINSDLFHNILDVVQSFGFTIRACVSDMGAENRKLWKELNVSEDTPWIATSQHKLYFFADVPHLLKLIRNHIIDNGITTPYCKLDKSVFESLFSKDCGELKLCHKVGTTHIDFPKLLLLVNVYGQQLNFCLRGCQKR